MVGIASHLKRFAAKGGTGDFPAHRHHRWFRLL